MILSGRHVLFVVNHPMEEPVADRIEKFVFDPVKQELVHQAYYSGDAMKVWVTGHSRVRSSYCISAGRSE